MGANRRKTGATGKAKGAGGGTKTGKGLGKGSQGGTSLKSATIGGHSIEKGASYYVKAGKNEFTVIKNARLVQRKQEVMGKTGIKTVKTSYVYSEGRKEPVTNLSSFSKLYKRRR